jgi:hypothetical protein
VDFCQKEKVFFRGDPELKRIVKRTRAGWGGMAMEYELTSLPTEIPTSDLQLEVLFIM